MNSPSLPALGGALLVGLALGAGCASRGDVDEAKQQAKTSTQTVQQDVQAVQQRVAEMQRSIRSSSADNRRRAETMARESAALRASAEKTAKAIQVLQESRAAK